jgi:glycine oxidase
MEVKRAMRISYDTIIVGGGVIGCSIAYQLARQGQKVVVLERGRLAAEASAAAGGMLGAQTEMEAAGPLFELGRRSRALFPQLAEELQELTGISIGLIREGLLYLARTEAEEHDLKARMGWQQKAGESGSWLTTREAIRMEPMLNPAFRGALYLQEDGQIDAPLLALALAKAAAALGTVLREYAQVTQLIADGGKVTGVMTGEGAIYADHVIVAAGTWSGALLGQIGLELPVYPVKGECFSVLTHSPILQRTVFTHGCYLVPKAGGRLLVGATVKEHSYDRKVSLEGLTSLAERAKQLVPVIGEAEWEKAWSGLRPQTPDGLPYLGRVQGYDGLVVATGHYRNGILLSPLTGKLIAQMVVTHNDSDASLEPYADWLAACSPFREASCRKELQAH